jgi:KAP family P-loop domain
MAQLKGGVVSQASTEEQGAQDPGGGNRASYQILSDVPSTTSTEDHLDFLPYATALATLIDRKATSTPLIAAISAPWGAGKTTLSELVQEQLRVPGEWDEPHIICRFNAWKHDDAPNLGAAFAAEVAQRANRHRLWWRRLAQPLPSEMLTPEQRWRRKCYIILISLAIATGLVLGAKSRNLITAVARPTDANWTAAEHAAHGWALALLILLAALTFIYPKIFAGAQSVARFITDPQSEAAQGSMNSVRDQLGKLIHAATRRNRRFIIFVDDLERCRPPRAVEVCEVASQLLDHRGVVTVLVGDMEAIALSAAIKYRALELPDANQADIDVLKTSYTQYGRTYLQKIVTIQFDLPPATPTQLKDMLQADLRASGSADQYDRPDRKQGWARVAVAVLSTIMVLTGPIIALNGQQERLAATQAALSEHRPVPANNNSLVIWGFILTILGLIPFITMIIIAYRRRVRTRATRRRIDQAIQSQSVGTTAEEAAENVVQTASGSSADSVRKRYLSAVLDTTGIVARADALVFNFLPDRPRAAKRLLNQVRLMLLIATGRGLFVLQDMKDQNSRADLIGKWLVLRERWPAIAQLVQREPDKMKDLEIAAGNSDGLQASLRSSGITELDDIKNLCRLLSMTPRFEELSALTFFSGTPAQNESTSSPSTPASGAGEQEESIPSTHVHESLTH